MGSPAITPLDQLNALFSDHDPVRSPDDNAPVRSPDDNGTLPSFTLTMQSKPALIEQRRINITLTGAGNDIRNYQNSYKGITPELSKLGDLLQDQTTGAPDYKFNIKPPERTQEFEDKAKELYAESKVPKELPAPSLPGQSPIERIAARTPEFAALEKEFQPIVTQAQQLAENKTYAEQGLKAVLASHTEDLAKQPVHIDPITGKSDFWSYFNETKEAQNQPVTIDLTEVYKQNAEKELQEYRKTNESINTVDIRTQHPDTYIKDIFGEGDPYAYTQAEPSLGKLPSLVHTEHFDSQLEGLDALHKLKKHLGV